MSEEKIHRLLQQAMGERQDNAEAFFNMTYTLAEQLQMPLTAVWMGDPVTVLAINTERSNHSHGIHVDVTQTDKPIPLAELTFSNLNPHNADWLKAYRYWHDEIYG
jgi:hypothetical protein